MKFTFAHNNLNVYDLDKSLEFYKEALGLTVTRTKDTVIFLKVIFITFSCVFGKRLYLIN